MECIRMDGIATIPEMTNEEYRKKISEIFDKMENNLVLRYFYNYILMIAADWNVPADKK